jgi:uncharacterized 2Fe-2S/4Fe-4S cluster protein (DUF4445 family)
MSEKSIVVDVQPIGKRVEIRTGETLLDAARAGSAGLVSLCGGEGWCGSCLVRIVAGDVGPPTQSEKENLGEEKIKLGFRLACQVIPATDIRIDLPPESLSTPQRLQVEGKEFELDLTPAVERVELELTSPSLKDLRSDATRVFDALTAAGHQSMQISYPILQEISEVLREYNWSTQAVVREGELIGLLPSGSNIFGVAVDVGTTKIALYLVDLQTGDVLGKTGVMNPQIAYGEDVVSRIAYCRNNSTGRKELQQVLIDTLNDQIQVLCTEAEIQASQVADMVVVGNTVMHHLITYLPVYQVVLAPYIPAVTEPMAVRARDLGIEIMPGGYIYLLPNIAGYVGADHSAVILSTELGRMKETVLAIDIGTNTEISLVHGGWITSCSCASGPAFEGAHIRHGMRAAPGAIERIVISKGKILTYTIDDQLPVGICGSGILDVVAELRTAEMINEKGAFLEGPDLIGNTDQQTPQLVLVPEKKSGIGSDITISRKDINEILLAKAAIRAGQDILLNEAGIQPEDIDHVIIAGAFGTYINIKNAIAIGMFPDIPPDRFQQVGNAAGMGAIQALLSKEKREEIKKVIRDIHYLELTTRDDFQQIFMRSMYLL